VTYWLVTSTFYGQWLPGDERGSVTNVRDQRAGVLQSTVRCEHSRTGETFEGAIPGLYRAAVEQLKGAPIFLNLAQAETLLEQFLETAAYRGWVFHAMSIMANHVPLVVECPPDIHKSQLLRDFKGYGARRLNRLYGRRAAGTWWSDGGSGRVIRNVVAAIYYVCHRQPFPLLVWSRERGRISISESHPKNKLGGSCLPPLTWEAR
jgi:REP element-mobilizing transposase RayT